MYPPFEPSHIFCVPENASVMDYVANNDVMLQYPYQSFDIFLKFISRYFLWTKLIKNPVSGRMSYKIVRSEWISYEKNLTLKT